MLSTLACFALTIGFAACGGNDEGGNGGGRGGVQECTHVFTEYISNGDATCTEDGTKTAKCDNGCEFLTSVTIPGGVEIIPSGAFSNCPNLTSVIISEGVTRIASESFYYCTSLKEVVIPNSMTRIGSFTFHGFSDLRVYYKGTAEKWEKLIDGYRIGLSDATVYYYSETQPTGNGNYWHYDDNGEIVVW